MSYNQLDVQIWGKKQLMCAVNACNGLIYPEVQMQLIVKIQMEYLNFLKHVKTIPGSGIQLNSLFVYSHIMLY